MHSSSAKLLIQLPGLALLASTWVACMAENQSTPLKELGPLPGVALEPAPVELKRLTKPQLENSLKDIFGPEIVVARAVEPDTAIGGLLALGSARTQVSELGVERYEALAYDIANQALENHRDAVVPCQPSGTIDLDCAQKALGGVGFKAWRRPLSDAELIPLVKVSTTAAGVLGDFYQGLSYGIAGLLQSPNFLYRVELGQGQGPERKYDSYELATRLSFLLWNTTPDQELLEAAQKGELMTDAGLKKQAERLIASPRLKLGVRNYFSELLHFYEWDKVSRILSSLCTLAGTLVSWPKKRRCS